MQLKFRSWPCNELSISTFHAFKELPTAAGGSLEGETPKDEEDDLTPTEPEESENEVTEENEDEESKEPEVAGDKADEPMASSTEMQEMGEEEQKEHDPEIKLVGCVNPDEMDTLEQPDPLCRPDSNEWDWSLDSQEDSQLVRWHRRDKTRVKKNVADGETPAFEENEPVAESSKDRDEEADVPLVTDLVSETEEDNRGTFKDSGKGASKHTIIYTINDITSISDSYVRILNIINKQEQKTTYSESL